MNEFNKNNLITGLNVFLIIAWALITIATCSVIWNLVPVTAAKLVAGGMFIFNGTAIAEKIIRFKKKNK